MMPKYIQPVTTYRIMEDTTLHNLQLKKKMLNEHTRYVADREFQYLHEKIHFIN